jgi:hypothetical protein
VHRLKALGLAAVLLSVVTGESIAYKQVAHRYIACKSIDGLQPSLPVAHAEFLEHAHCDRCTIYRKKCGKSEFKLYRKQEEKLKWQGADICFSEDPRRASYTPPQCLKDKQGECKEFYDGDDLIVGSSEEDADVIEARNIFVPVPSYLEHFWNPDLGLDVGVSGILTKKYLCSPTTECFTFAGSYQRAESWWNQALAVYPTDKRKAYYYLGRAAHLLSDLTVPAHVHGDAHPGYAGRAFFESCCDPDAKKKGDKDHSLEEYAKKESILGQYDNVEVSPYVVTDLLSDQGNFDWSDVVPPSVDESLFKLFWFAAQKTQYLASTGDNPKVKRESRCDAENACLAIGHGDEGKYVKLNTPSREEASFDPPLLTNITDVDKACELTKKMPKRRKDLITGIMLNHAFSAVAGLYRLFWDKTHDADGDGSGVVTDCDDNDPDVFDGSQTFCFDGAPWRNRYGTCMAGSRTCASGVFSSCIGQVLPSIEICNDLLDNDCDGFVDCADTKCWFEAHCSHCQKACRNNVTDLECGEQCDVSNSGCFRRYGWPCNRLTCRCLICGDRQCNREETPCTCPEDCGDDPCGNGICCALTGETSATCSEDCS